MAICSGCDGKFGSNGDPEVEVQSSDVDDEGNVTVEVEIQIPCGNCGSEFKAGNLTLEGQFGEGHDDECTFDFNGQTFSRSESGDEAYEAAMEAAGGREWELISDGDIESTEDYRPKFKTKKNGAAVLDKDGNRVPVPFRYQRHYYGATMTVELRCSLCEETFEGTLEGDISASELEEVG